MFRIYLPAAFLSFLLGNFLPSVAGEEIYQKYCSTCHHPQKIGISAPPLLKESIEKYSDEKLKMIIKNGIPSTQMPSFKDLSEQDIDKIISFLRKDNSYYDWKLDDISKSIYYNAEKKKNLDITSIKNLTFVVERGRNLIWIMENENIVDKFEFGNVHGGIKYTLDGKNFYIPSRDGWIGYYKVDVDNKNGYFAGKVRACIYLRNIAISNNGKFLLVGCILPKNIYILDAKTLYPKTEIKLNGTISAIYELYREDKAIFTFKDKPVIGIIDTNSLEVEYKNIHNPIEDFFIDPFDEFLIGTSRSGKKMDVYKLNDFNLVFSYDIDSMPHLFSASFWYKDGKFYFATPHVGSSYISVWQMYDWKFIKKVEIGGNGYFVKTHPSTDYLWVDNSSDKLVLIDKKTFSVKSITLKEGKKFTHTEFNSDGTIGYLSIYDRNGYILLLDTRSLKEIKAFSADLPVGKYNFTNKGRNFYSQMLGQDIFQEKCWGCHHQTQQAFGPSFKDIAKRRTEGEIMAQILNPENYYKVLGYKRNSMPKFDLNTYELRAITSYIKSFGGL